MRKGYGNAKANKVWPMIGSRKDMNNLKTVGATLSAKEAISLVVALSKALDTGASEIDITITRKNGQISVSSL